MSEPCRVPALQARRGCHFLFRPATATGMMSALMSHDKSKEQLEREKLAAARAALRWVRSGMTLGLGTGSTADYFIDLVGESVRAGSLQVEAVASSEASEGRAAAAGILMIAPRRGLRLDLAVDGADEVDPDLGLIKGRGAALLREKVLAQASNYFLVIADSSKLVARLGLRGLPIEVVPFALPWVMDQIEELGGKAVVLMDRNSPEKAAVSDQRNFLLDCRFGAINDPQSLGARLDNIAGVVGHGLFLGYARAAVIAEGSEVTVLRPDSPPTPAAHFDHLPDSSP
jgi:ribose 5-phosphate isomerase A